MGLEADSAAAQEAAEDLGREVAAHTGRAVTGLEQRRGGSVEVDTVAAVAAATERAAGEISEGWAG